MTKLDSSVLGMGSGRRDQDAWRFLQAFPPPVARHRLVDVDAHAFRSMMGMSIVLEILRTRARLPAVGTTYASMVSKRRWSRCVTCSALHGIGRPSVVVSPLRSSIASFTNVETGLSSISIVLK